MPPTPPTQILSTSTAAIELGLTRTAATTIMRCGVAGEVFADGRALACRPEAIEALRSRRLADTSVPAIQVKLTVPEWDAIEGRWTGWNEGFTDEEKEAASAQWWQVADPDRLVAAEAALVATVVSFVVRVRKIVGYERTNHYGRRVRFFTEESDEEQRSAYEGRRFDAEPGPLTKLWGRAEG